MLKYNLLKSGWQDSNLRPPAPKAGAITGLRYTPKNALFSINWAANIRINHILPWKVSFFYILVQTLL